jgi:preprotein translocase subunit SecE
MDNENLPVEKKSAAVAESAKSGSVATKPAAASQFLADAKEYFEDLKMEMRRVTWPNRKQVEATTTVVIVSVFAFAAYFQVVDFVIERSIAQIFTRLAK